MLIADPHIAANDPRLSIGKGGLDCGEPSGVGPAIGIDKGQYLAARLADSTVARRSGAGVWLCKEPNIGPCRTDHLGQTRRSVVDDDDLDVTRDAALRMQGLQPNSEVVFL